MRRAFHLLVYRISAVFLSAAVLVTPTVGANGLNQGVAGASLEVLFPGAVFNESVPTQQQITGTEPGLRPLRPEEVVEYFKALDEASPRARFVEYARSYEGRPLVYLAISDETTIANLQSFKSEHRRLLDSRIESRSETENNKAVAWMAYGIHGDELSSTDAAAALAYWLVAGEDDRAKSLRRGLLILIDPNENPDGRARYLAQTLSFAHRTANPDQDDLSHSAVWPWGRGNHYLFDLNRDWFTMTQPESARSKEIAAWLPQLMVDSHEMGDNSTYLFPPSRHPFNPLLPANARAWERPFSADQAAALDARGFPYFTGEWNEEFFPGYGSSWASYHGAVGILYEMSGTSGTLVRKRGGTVRTFAQAVEHQVASSVANLSTLADNVDAVIRDQIEARSQAVKAGTSDSIRCWVFPADPRHPERLAPFAQLLLDQGVEVEILKQKAVKADDLKDARTGATVVSDLEPGTLRVRLDQPGGAMARVLLDPHVPMESVFFQDEREYIEKGKGSRLYETTAWSLPLIRGVRAFWGSKSPSGDWRPWSASEHELKAPDPVTGPWTSIIVDGDSDRSAPFLAGLLQAGITVRIAEKPVTIGGASFHRGAIVIRKEGNVENVLDVVNRLAARFSMQLHVVTTSRPEDGPYLGGSHFKNLIAPRVGVLTGMPVSPTSYGYVWHLLDQELDLRFSGLDIGRFARTDLSRYNVLVFPPVWGGVSAYRDLLGQGGVERLRNWIEEGGTAIGIGGGARMLADKETGLTRARFRSQALADAPPPVWSIPALQAESAGKVSAMGLRVVSSDSENQSESPGGRESNAQPTSPYDVAPILGPGARPFVDGFDQGTVLAAEPVSMSEWLGPMLPEGRKTASEKDLETADRRLRSFMSRGILLRADLDQEFWLNFGLGEDVTVWFGSDDTLVAEAPVAVAARFAEIDRLHLGGLLWPEAAARTAHTAYATREPIGRGQVILFADHPAYRRWMVETERMLINAVLYGPGLGTRWSRPW